MGSGKYIKRKVMDWETDKEIRWKESKEEERGAEGEG